MINENEPIIKTIDLHKSFGKLHVLKGVNEQIMPKEVVSIVGPSGGGKSTFLRCLNMLEIPEQGQIFIEGTEITNSKVDINLHRQKMGMVFQHFNVFPHLTVLENVTVAPTLVKKIDKKAYVELLRIINSTKKKIGAREVDQKMRCGINSNHTSISTQNRTPSLIL
jgi:polar amino acid transport system ATP-binding protein